MRNLLVQRNTLLTLAFLLILAVQVYWAFLAIPGVVGIVRTGEIGANVDLVKQGGY